jgi:solute carrier family 25 oxoglutarate transporter 11
MAYHQINDIKRDRLPYFTDNYWVRPTWAPEIYNTPYLNFKKAAVGSALAGVFIESARHLRTSFIVLNYVYEYPKNSLQWSIYWKEMFKVPNFWSELRKRVVFGTVQHSLDAALKVSIYHYIYGGTWSPYQYADFAIFKPFISGLLSGVLLGWTNYSLSVARRAYYADLTWPEELRKGYRSPLHALLKIPFTEGPLYLFRGGLLHWMGNSLGFAWLMFAYTFLKDKLAYLYRYNDVNYSFMKFIFLNLAFGLSAIGSQPFFTMKEIMDTAPKQRGGKNSFNTSWEAFRYLKCNWDILTANYVSGYFKWFRRHGAVLYCTLWYCDNLGMLDNFKVDPNSLETTFAKHISD